MIAYAGHMLNSLVPLIHAIMPLRLKYLIRHSKSSIDIRIHALLDYQPIAISVDIFEMAHIFLLHITGYLHYFKTI